MSQPVLILRPQPGNDATATRLRDAGVANVVQAPLFSVAPCVWNVVDPHEYDAVLLTSANALRHGGAGLSRYHHLPCACVGEPTAQAARAAGFDVRWVGDSDGDTLLAGLPPLQHPTQRILWLYGREHSQLSVPRGMTITPLPVYHTTETPLDGAAIPHPAIALLHSSRAALRFRALATDPAAFTLVTISAKVARAAGPGWRDVHFPDTPEDRKMVAIAAKLCHELPPRA